VEEDSNADLLAAAPELLAALEDLATCAKALDDGLHAGIKLAALSAEQSRVYNAVNSARGIISTLNKGSGQAK